MTSVQPQGHRPFVGKCRGALWKEFSRPAKPRSCPSGPLHLGTGGSVCPSGPLYPGTERFGGVWCMADHGHRAWKRAGGQSTETSLPAKNLPSHHPSFYFIITRGEKPDQQAFHPFDFQESTEPPSCKKRFPITSATFLSI